MRPVGSRFAASMSSAIVLIFDSARTAIACGSCAKNASGVYVLRGSSSSGLLAAFSIEPVPTVSTTCGSPRLP